MAMNSTRQRKQEKTGNYIARTPGTLTYETSKSNTSNATNGSRQRKNPGGAGSTK